MVNNVPDSDEDDNVLLQGYNIIEIFVDSNDELYKRRLNSNVGHQNIYLPVSIGLTQT